MDVKAMFAKLAKTKKEAKVKQLKSGAASADQPGTKQTGNTKTSLKDKLKQQKAQASGKKAAVSTTDSNARRRKTDDGFNLYTEEELGLGEPGSTPDCPFDCQCCT